MIKSAVVFWNTCPNNIFMCQVFWDTLSTVVGPMCRSCICDRLSVFHRGVFRVNKAWFSLKLREFQISAMCVTCGLMSTAKKNHNIGYL